MPSSAPLELDLRRDGLRCGDQRIGNRLLPRLFARLLLDPQARLSALPELHRTQLWRALRSLKNTPLEGALQAEGASTGPLWLVPAFQRRLHVTVEGVAASPTRLRGLLEEPGPHAPRTGSGLPSPTSLAALDEADRLFDRGAYLPARARIESAAARDPQHDPATAAALTLRQARIARRLRDWQALQAQLHALRRLLRSPQLGDAQRRQLGARTQVLAAWHRYGSLGQPASAARLLAQVDATVLDYDPVLRCDYFNLRGMILRSQLLAGPAGSRDVTAVLDCFGEALRAATLTAMPDALQVSAANLANTLAQLLDAGCLADPAQNANLALQWLLLSEAVCTRWELAASSLLNAVFLLRLALENALSLKQVQQQAQSLGLTLPGRSFCEFARETWAQRHAVHSQIPAEQRCAFFLVWAEQALRERQLDECLAQCRRVAHELRKLPNAALRARYREELSRIQAAARGETK